jgi:hypothetical protein
MDTLGIAQHQLKIYFNYIQGTVIKNLPCADVNSIWVKAAMANTVSEKSLMTTPLLILTV